MITSSESASDPPEDPPERLVFSWDYTTSARWRLTFFLIIAAAVHIGFFYLFRVVYPQPARSIPSPEQITILSPSNPLARPTLAQVADRVSALVAGDSRSADIADYSTRFVPSFKDFDLTLRILPDFQKPAELPLLTVPGATIFPPLAIASPNTSVATEPREAGAKLTLAGDLVGRKILREPAWDPPALANLPERRFRFSAGFDPRGRPIFILPLESPGNPDSPETARALATFLKSLRLNPASSPASGILDITW